MNEDTRGCATCAHGSSPADQEPCATCIKYTEPWKPNWQPSMEAARIGLEAAAVNAQMRAAVGAMPFGKPINNGAQGTTPEAMATQGVKFDADKPRMDLLDPTAIQELAKVLTFGANKYAAHNWRKGIAKGRLIAAALRHLFAYLGGEDKDPETGLSHAAHAMCCCMFLLGLEHRTDLDDRYKEAA